MDSPGHRRNILLPGLDRFGFGFAGNSEVLYAVQTFAGPGLPRGAEGGERPARLPPGAETVTALAAINEARGRAGAAELRASPALAQAARALLPPPGGGAGELAPAGDLIAAIPDGQRSGWQAVSVVLGSCGGCGAAPAAADVRSFQERWLADPAYRRTLLDPRMTHLGFALAANGGGAKTTLAMLGDQR